MLSALSSHQTVFPTLPGGSGSAASLFGGQGLGGTKRKAPQESTKPPHSSPPSSAKNSPKRSRPNRPERNVTNACDLCKKKHLKCDGEANCSHCQKRGMTCTFSKHSKRRGPKPKRFKDVNSLSAASSTSPALTNTALTAAAASASACPNASTGCGSFTCSTSTCALGLSGSGAAGSAALGDAGLGPNTTPFPVRGHTALSCGGARPGFSPSLLPARSDSEHSDYSPSSEEDDTLLRLPQLTNAEYWKAKYLELELKLRSEQQQPAGGLVRGRQYSAATQAQWLAAFNVNVRPIFYRVQPPLLDALHYHEEDDCETFSTMPSSNPLVDHRIVDKYLLCVILGVGARICRDEEASAKMMARAKAMLDRYSEFLLCSCAHTGFAFLLMTYYLYGSGDSSKASYYTMLAYWIAQEAMRPKNSTAHRTVSAAAAFIIPQCTCTKEDYRFLTIFSLAHLASCTFDAEDRKHWISKALEMHPGAVDSIYLTVHVVRSELLHNFHSTDCSSLLRFLDDAERAIMTQRSEVDSLDNLSSVQQTEDQMSPVSRSFSWFHSFRFVLYACRAGIYWRAGMNDLTAEWAKRASMLLERERINRTCLGCAFMLSFVLRFNMEQGNALGAAQNMRQLQSYVEIWPVIRAMVRKCKESMCSKPSPGNLSSLLEDASQALPLAPAPAFPGSASSSKDGFLFSQQTDTQPDYLLPQDESFLTLYPRDEVPAGLDLEAEAFFM